MTATSYEVTRGRVLMAAADLFARNGYHGTGVAELGRAVGLGKGALYRYIGSKEAILYAISKDQVDNMNRYAEQVIEADLEPGETIREMARGLLVNIAAHRAEWTVFFREWNALTGEWRDQVIAARERYESCWRQALSRGVRRGDFHLLPPVAVKGILGMLNYTYLWFNPNGDITPEELAEHFIDIVLYGIAAPDAQHRGAGTSPATPSTELSTSNPES